MRSATIEGFTVMLASEVRERLTNLEKTPQLVNRSSTTFRLPHRLLLSALAIFDLREVSPQGQVEADRGTFYLLVTTPTAPPFNHRPALDQT
jgi:hypothetical protein